MSQVPPQKPQMSAGWIIFWVIVAFGCCAGLAGNSGSGGSGTTNTGPGSASCREQGKQEFTDFRDPAWKRYVQECSPPGLK